MPPSSSDRPLSPGPASPAAAGPAHPAGSAPAGLQFPPTGRVTLILIAVCVAIYLWSLQGVDPATVAELSARYPGLDIDANTARFLPFFISMWPFSSPDGLWEVRHGEIWRLFTPALIHFSVAHLGFNMLGMQSLGSAVEAQNGRRFYILLMAVLALATNLAQYIAVGPAFGGMSGVLYGLFGYIWLRSVCDEDSGFYMPRSTIVIAMVWLLACFTGILGPIANMAHTTGVILGAIFGVVTGRLARRRYRASAGHRG